MDSKVEPNEAQIKLSYETAVYREQLRLLQGEIDRVSLTLLDLENSLRTLENLKIDDSLVQIGGGAFIKSTIYSTNVLVPVGAGYFVEMSKEQGIIEIRKRIESTKKAVEKLREEFEKVSKKLHETSINLRNIQAAVNIAKRVEENEHLEYV